MRVVLLAAAASLAAVLAPATPAAALDPAGSQFTAGAAAAVTVHRGNSGHVTGGFPRGLSGDRDRDRRRHRGGGDVFFGEREYQGDTAFRPDGFNDWWHERTWRSYPRWVQNNDGCEREWQGGGVWRCSW